MDVPYPALSDDFKGENVASSIHGKVISQTDNEVPTAANGTTSNDIILFAQSC
jgi:hypothetical protein